MRRFAAALLILASCATTPKPAAQGNGTSCADAVVINATDESSGLKAEYAWLAEHYPGYKRGNQSLGTCDSAPADIIEITTKAGEKKTVYFNIASFFGKWK